MDVRQIDDGVYVSGQIYPDDIAVLAEAGIKTLICNRPDGEASDQIDFATIERSARHHGIDVYYIPVVTTGISPANISDMKTALEKAVHPLLAYCRTGTRSAMLYSLARQKPDENMTKA